MHLPITTSTTMDVSTPDMKKFVRLVLRRVGTAAIALAWSVAGTALVAVDARAQLTAPSLSTFTPDTVTVAGSIGNWIAVRNTASMAPYYLSDYYDNGNLGTDPTKQNGLNGSSSGLDIVGFNPNTVATTGIYVPSIVYSLGTFNGAAALAVAIDLAGSSNGKIPSNAGAIVLFNPNNVSGSVPTGGGGMWGVAWSNPSSGGPSILLVTPKAGTTLNSAFQFSDTALATAENGASWYSYAPSGSTISNTDYWLTFVVLKSSLDAAGIAMPTLTTGITAFTDNSALASSGNINADWIGGSTATSDLNFGTGQGVPEAPTGILAATLLVPFAALHFWRRNRTAAA